MKFKEHLEDGEGIVQLRGKLTTKQAVEIAKSNERFDNLRADVWDEFVSDHTLRNAINDKLRAGKLGPPNAVLRDYESSPGVWVFDDKPTGVRLMLFSDLHKKNAFKGTSYEYVPGKPEQDVAEAFKRLLAYIESL